MFTFETLTHGHLAKDWLTGRPPHLLFFRQEAGLCFPTGTLAQLAALHCHFEAMAQPQALAGASKNNGPTGGE